MNKEFKKIGLSHSKNDLLKKWLEGDADIRVQTITRRPSNEFPLSFTQKRQLFLEVIDPGTAVNNLSVCLEIKGELRYPLLQESINQILQRHEVLRTCFAMANGWIKPELMDHVELKIHQRNLVADSKSGTAIREEALHLAKDIAIRSFDLFSAPLIRIEILKSEKVHYLVIVIHHSISDGWSLGVFLKELTSIYNSQMLGQINNLPGLEIQYADYAYWQVDRFKNGMYQESLSYWKNKLKGELSVLDLPKDNQRRARQSFNGGTYRFEIPNSVIKRLEEFGQQHETTLFMSLLSVYTILLFRYTSQEELIIGTPVAGRNHTELEGLIGSFINLLALRIDLNGQVSFFELLKAVRDISIEALAHQEVPFEKLVEELRPTRDISHSPIFQTVFNMQNTPLPDLSIQNASIELLEIDRGVSEVDLTLLIFQRNGTYSGTIEYNNDLFSIDTIQRIFKSFLILLNAIIENPEKPISGLQLISNEERECLIRNGENLSIPFPKEKSFSELFEEQVERCPDKLAVTNGNQIYTYRELENKANLIASMFSEMGISKGDRIAICLGRSVELLPLLLASQKANAICVPVHPGTPPNRMEFILQEAETKLLITDKKWSFHDSAIEVFDIVDLGKAISELKQSSVNFDHPLPNDLAYIMFTSGSTGNPKGVMIKQQSLTNFLWSMKSKPGMVKSDVLLAVTPISFDIAILESFLPLMTGSTVVIASDEEAINPNLLAEKIDEHNVTIMQATPATWQLLVDSGWKGNYQMKALCGGDRLTRKLADKILKRCGSLWNMYGPTETTIWSTIQKIEKEDEISIGTSINNTSTYILDENLEPVPQGSTGELFIGGEGVAVGYLKNNKLNQEKFIPSPFGDHFSLYRTGDKVRYRSDFSLELVGRADQQVKLNGHRIELNEIGHLLTDHYQINESVVVVSESGGQKSLVAYYVPEFNHTPSNNELRNFLKERLPLYMVPSVFIALSQLPLTDNGKVDRKVLPKPDHPRNGSEHALTTNDIERLLVRIWEDVLHVKPIGIHDNFFELGGTSIQSIQISTIATSSDLFIQPENVFEYQTIEQLSRFLESNENLDNGR